MNARPRPPAAHRRLIDAAGFAVAAAALVFVSTRGEVVSWLWR